MRRIFVLAFVACLPLCAYSVSTTSSGKPWHWPTRNIKYWINPTGSGLSSNETQIAIQSAFQSWEQTGTGLQFSFMGFTDSLNSVTDHQNVVFWSSDRTLIPAGVYAETIPAVDPSTGEILDMDIVFNQRGPHLLTESLDCGGFTAFNVFGIPLVWNSVDQRFHFGLLFGTDTYLTQVQATATHEIGHLLGLAHSTVLGASMSTVYVTPVIWCNTTQVVLKADDFAGIQYLYPSTSSPQTFYFTGTVTVVTDPNGFLGQQVLPGNSLFGTFTYNLNATDLNADPTFGEYQDTTGVSKLSVTVNTQSGPRTVTADLNTTLLIADSAPLEVFIYLGFGSSTKWQFPFLSPGLIYIALDDGRPPFTFLTSDRPPTSLDFTQTEDFTLSTHSLGNSHVSGGTSTGPFYDIQFRLTSLTKI